MYQLDNYIQARLSIYKVRWVKGVGGGIQIIHIKGDIWALNRHLSRKWNALTPNNMIYNFDSVEVLGDYTGKELGVTGHPLFKIPSYMLTGQEAPNAPSSCWELDPAAQSFKTSYVGIEAQGKEVADTSNIRRTCGESKDLEKSNVIGNNNLTKGEKTPRVSMIVVKQRRVIYSERRRKKQKQVPLKPKEKQEQLLSWASRQ
ncbi:hypothetical protein KY284_035564 [Solanum tuberosum]|nr:hypothetical protein KY284_035564 [Solanum tuberosum]